MPLIVHCHQTLPKNKKRDKNVVIFSMYTLYIKNACPSFRNRLEADVDAECVYFE